VEGDRHRRVKVFDSHETVLEEDVFHDREGYAGVMRTKAEIGVVRILTCSESPDTTDVSRFYIDDLSFGRVLKAGY
jgi:xanthine dehydrogenase molybdopterin-binding subunit B